MKRNEKVKKINLSLIRGAGSVAIPPKEILFWVKEELAVRQKIQLNTPVTLNYPRKTV